MDLLDSHAHLNTIPWLDLEKMYLAGIKMIISPIFLDAGRPVSNTTIKEMWDYLFDIHFNRAKENFIKPFAMIGISMVSTPAENQKIDDLFKIMKEYLLREDVVGIGEIGFEPNSKTSSNINFQENLVIKQIQLAKELKLPLDFHTPNNSEQKIKYTKKIISLCKDIKIPEEQIIINHCSEENIKMVLDAGIFAAISVQPFRNLGPKKAAEIIKKYGDNQILINSDFGSPPSDPLAVPKTALACKRIGIEDNSIKKVCYLNAKACFKI